MTHESPTLGRPVRSAGDARELWRAHFGDTPVPANRPKPSGMTEPAWQEVAQRDQLAAVSQRLAAVGDMPWPETEAAWLDALRVVRSIFRGQHAPTRKAST